ncbi:MAG: hypothetical protein JST55_02250 [Bacteroidetes bacterium]|nr:hypothetical protein [Bacteroidota bacterium]
MKKILFTAFLLLFVTTISSAQKLLPIKPSVEIIVKGAFGTPLSDDNFKNSFKSFPGGQLEVVGNITSSFGVYGNFSADFLSAKDQSAIGQTITQDNTYMLSGSVGPRFYFNLPGSILYRFFGDVGFGIYATRLGDRVTTTVTTPPFTVTTDRHNVYTQTGFNIGAGINIGLGPLGLANVTLKYHNLMSKSNVQVINTRTIEGSNPSVNSNIFQDVPSSSYFSVAVGLGFKIGL